MTPSYQTILSSERWTSPGPLKVSLVQVSCQIQGPHTSSVVLSTLSGNFDPFHCWEFKNSSNAAKLELRNMLQTRRYFSPSAADRDCGAKTHSKTFGCWDDRAERVVVRRRVATFRIRRSLLLKPSGCFTTGRRSLGGFDTQQIKICRARRSGTYQVAALCQLRVDASLQSQPRAQTCLSTQTHEEELKTKQTGGGKI